MRKSINFSNILLIMTKVCLQQYALKFLNCGWKLRKIINRDLIIVNLGNCYFVQWCLVLFVFKFA